jgi:ribonuclease HI
MGRMEKDQSRPNPVTADQRQGFAQQGAETDGGLKPRLKIFFDGGCRPNPGIMETAVVARGVTYHAPDVGYGTNNDAEWLALIEAVKLAHTFDTDDVVLLGDSTLVVNQANGKWPCRSAALQAHLDTLHSICEGQRAPTVRYIRRSQNLAGIALKNRG